MSGETTEAGRGDPRALRYYDLVMAAFVAILLLSNILGAGKVAMVRLPLVGAPVVPSRYGQRYAMGWVTGAHGTPGYVSRGLGLSGLPLRNLCEPEITLLRLVPAS